MSKLMNVSFKVLDLLVIFMMTFGAAMPVAAAPSPTGATIASDKVDYPAGATVTLTGAGWANGEVVHIVVNDTIGQTWQYTADVTADSSGAFTDVFSLPNYFVSDYDVTATGPTSGMATTTFTDVNPAANLDQCANLGNVCDTANQAQWQNGNLGSQQALYQEGDSVPYRARLINLTVGKTYVLGIQWDTTDTSKHALDYLTSYDRTVTTADPCSGGACSGSPVTTVVPQDTTMLNSVSGGGVSGWQGGTQISGNFSLWGGTFPANPVSAYNYTGVTGAPGNGAIYTASSKTGLTVTFVATGTSAVLAWGGHIATRVNWGQGNSAAIISGSPFHMRLVTLTTPDDNTCQGKNPPFDCGMGQQDRSLSAAAVVSPGSITIIKDATLNGATSFPFTASPSPLSNFSLVDDGTTANTKVFANITNFQTYNVAESVPSGWTLTGIVCSVTSANGGSQTVSLPSVSINLKEGENVTCTFSDEVTFVPNPHLSITKVATEAGYSNAGDVIHYTIVATNDGNTTLAAVTVTDAQVTDLTCTPANGSSLAPGGTIACSASHTVTQADVDAGSFYNQACVDDGTGGADQACADVTTPGSKTPHLSITKEATESTYSAVGDVIHYTIVATNDGNTTLAAVTITDANATLGTCTPANGSPLAPGASMNCTASHTIVQADIDAGHYFNQACVDDGADGADKQCASTDTPGTQNPAIDLVKNGAWNDGNGNGLADVGETISYTFKVTNTGNVTLHNVTIADKIGGITVSGGPITSLAPGASDSTTFTGTYTLTQADIDAGSFYNVATACGLSPIDVKVCDDGNKTVTFPPRLIVKKLVINDNGDTKKATDFSFKVNSGSVITFLQDGSDTLKGLNVVTVTGSYTVTEPAVYGYTTTYSSDCTGTLAAGETKTCTITNNDQPGTIIVKKISDPVNTGSFAFTTTGSGYTGFTIPGGGQNSQALNAGSYTVKEGTQLGWTLTGIGGSTDPNTPYNCTVTGSGGSTGVGDLNTMTATVSLKNGDTVTCVFENTSNGATRTQGFWATHPQLAAIAWNGGSAFGHTFPGVASILGDTTLCGRTLTINASVGAPAGNSSLMGGFWSDVSKTTLGKKRTALDQARMQLLQQLLAAELNASAFGSLPSGGVATINSWEAAYCGTNQTTIKNAQQAAASFNTKGDSSTFTPGTSADSKFARYIADLKFWDLLP